MLFTERDTHTHTEPRRQHATPKEAAMRFAEGVQGLYKEQRKNIQFKGLGFRV